MKTVWFYGAFLRYVPLVVLTLTILETSVKTVKWTSKYIKASFHLKLAHSTSPAPFSIIALDPRLRTSGFQL